MSKESRGTLAAKKEDSTAKVAALPPEIAELIRGRSVHIEPDRYFAKLWITRLPFVQDQVTQSGRDTFTLSPELFEHFLSRLVDSLRSKPKIDFGLTPSDRICEALASIATPGHFDEWSFEDNWQTVDLPRDLLTMPDLARTANPNTFELNVAFRPDPFDPDSPALEISVVGEAVDIFSELRNVQNRTPSEKRALQRHAHRFWEFLSKKISERLTIEGLRGRPTSLGGLYAFLRDHRGQTWLQIAKASCREKRCKDLGRHDHSCQERFRKAAELYWKRERKEFADLAKAKRAAAKSC